jgi:glycosyltransferase involved in cell wall biosynthesis
MFAQKYLLKQEKKPLLVLPPKAGTKMIVVIPCFNEPDIAETLQSLASCTSPPFPVEVLVVINHSENESEEIKHYNRKTLLAVQKLIKETTTRNITFYVVGPVELRKKWAGAGLARKTGMDEAVLRFNTLGNPEGIIVSLDADTWVEQNYFIEIEKYFRENSAKVGATISFRHRTAGLTKKHLQGIQLYEKYLWYYKYAVQFTG